LNVTKIFDIILFQNIVNKLIKKIFKSTKKLILKLVKSRGSLHQIALGFAIGVFIGVFPTFGLGLIFTSALAVIIRFNLPASIIGGAVSTNPLTTPLCIAASYKIGELITGTKINLKITDSEFVYYVSNFKKFGLNFMIGNFVLSLCLSIISYFAVKAIIAAYRKKHKKLN